MKIPYYTCLSFDPGYGNSVSNLPLALTSDMDGKLAVCYVAYDGWNTAMNTTLILDISKYRHMPVMIS